MKQWLYYKNSLIDFWSTFSNWECCLELGGTGERVGVGDAVNIPLCLRLTLSINI